jgi:acyl carrier protein
MTREEAFEVVKSAVAAVVPDFDGEITQETHLTDEDVIDSLDSMNLLFELEEKLGKKLVKIDEDFEDYKVSTLVDIIVAAE